MPCELVTARLRLGPWHDSDLEPNYAMVHERDPRTAAAPRDGSPTRDDLLQNIHLQQRALHETGIALLAVRRNGAFIGYCGLTVGRATLDEPEIAYEMLAEYHGNGYATEAAQAVVSAASMTGRARLWASVRIWNTASFRVLTKLGFAMSGTSMDDGFGPSEWWTLPLAMA